VAAQSGQTQAPGPTLLFAGVLVRGANMSSYQQRIEQLFAPADIVINGNRPWDITVHNGHLFRRLLAHGSLGLGESYMLVGLRADR